MMQKFTKTERVVILNKEDQRKINASLVKTGKVALHELTDEERKEILDYVKEQDKK